MNSQNSNTSGRPAPPPEPMRKSVLVVALVVVLGVVGALLAWRGSGKKESVTTSEPDLTAVAQNPSPATIKPPVDNTDAEPTAVHTPPPVAPVNPSVALRAAKPPAPDAPAPPPKPEPSAHTRQFVMGISQIDLTKPITAETAAAWKQSFQQLTQQGAAAIPAIEEFLAKNMDLNFSAADAGNLLGQPSMRYALFDALRQIGGPEGIAATAATLQGTADPREIAILARNLEAQAPEQYREAALAAAREALAMAAAGNLPGRDIGPLFGVFQQYGGANAVPDLEKATGQWRYYGAIALANLPDGAGVPSLIQMANDPRGGQGRVAMEMLAQVADQSETARAALLAKAQAGPLPNATWMQLASVLGGEKFQIIDQVVNPNVPIPGGSQSRSYHLSSGNQNFYSYPDPAVFSADQINQRVGMIDQLLGTAKDPVAADALQKARAALLARPKQ